MRIIADLAAAAYGRRPDSVEKARSLLRYFYGGLIWVKAEVRVGKKVLFQESPRWS